MESIQYSQQSNQGPPKNSPGRPMPQGMPPQGMPPQGMPPQGMPRGIPAHGMPPQAMPPQKGQAPISDNLSSLPTDKNNPSEVDKNMTDTIFGANLSITQKLVKEGKDMMIIGLLFISLSLPQVDELIKKFVPATQNSVYILILIKAIMVMVLFWLIKHFYLSRN